jgi:chemotaxis signal transduction protein
MAATESLEVLLIHLGRRDFALPLGQVRYVSAMPTDFAYAGAGAEEFFLFEGAALPYLPLWDRLKQDSSYKEYADLLTMLPQRRQDHIDWMGALETSLRQGAPFAKARSPHECAFGKWYYAYQPADRRLGLLLGRFEAPHAHVHGLADELLGLAEQGRRDEALSRFKAAEDTVLHDLLRLFDAAETLVNELQRRILVVFDDEGTPRALGADGVRDIVTVPPERVQRGGASGGGERTLLILDDGRVVPLLDEAVLRP